MSAVHASHGPLKPASPHLRSEVDIVCSLARLATLGDRLRHPVGGVPRRLHRDPAAGSPAWCRASRRTTRRSTSPAASRCRTRRATRGRSRPRPARRCSRSARSTCCDVPEGRLLLQTLRSHDQFNTTIYGLDDRYRGIKGGRRVVFVHPDDIAALGFADGDDGRPRQRVVATARSARAPDFRVVAYDQPRGCAAAYYPETNPLVPLGLHRRAAATARRRSRSSSGSSRPAGQGSSSQRRGSTSRPATRSGRSSRSTCHEQPRGQARRARLRVDAGRRRRDHDAARGAARRAAGDARAAHAAAAAAVPDRRLVLRRPLRPRRRRRHRRHGRAAAPAHRAADGELAVHRRDRAPRQRRPPRDGPARRAQPDDRRPRHQPLRGVDRRRRRRCTAPSSGWRCPTPPGTLDPAFAHHAPTRSPAPAARPGCSSARCSATPRRCRRTRPLLGAELLLDPAPRSTLDVDPSFEHGVLVDAGVRSVGGVEPSAATSPTSRPGRRRSR